MTSSPRFSGVIGFFVLPPLLLSFTLFAQEPAPSPLQNSAPQPGMSVNFEMPRSRNPLNAYSPDSVPEPNLSNSPHLEQLVRDGKLYLSLKDAIELALEDNLDLAIARYNMPIAE